MVYASFMENHFLYIPQHQLNLLDWDHILGDLRSHFHFEANSLQIEAKPFLAFSSIEHSLTILGQFISDFDHLSALFARRVNFLSGDNALIERTMACQKGVVLDNRELNFAAHLIELFLDFQRSISPEIFELELGDLQHLKRNFLRPLRQFLDEYGTIHYDKHPELSEVQKKIQTLDQKLRERIQSLLKENPYSGAAQFNQYDIINERYVIPIRSDSYQHHLGAIIAKSNTGMTLFVEPIELREISNTRMQLMAQRDDILNKIFIKYSQLLTQDFKNVQQIVTYALKVDLHLSKASFCEKRKLSCPEISLDDSCEILGYFHPLLQNPVVNDLELTEQEHGIIISGPNTGGKTVTLKSLSLCHLFMHMGLYVPASFARLPLIKSLYYFSHDQQDLSQGLSSFSSEAKNYLELLDSISDHSYVFIDEIFNSTSSEEASALAIGLLNELHDRAKIKVFLSTHHQLLKTFMHSNNSYLSCHVGYDFEADTPTYKIIKGTPGSSLALSIFKKLSLKRPSSNQIFAKASSIMETKQVSYESLLEELTAKKTQLDKTLSSNQLLQRELQNQKSASEGILFLEREKLKKEFRKKLDSLLSKAETWFKETKSNPDLNKKSFYRELDQLKYQSHAELSAAKNDPYKEKNSKEHQSSPLKEEEIQLNQQYYCSLLKSDVEVIALNLKRKKVQARKGGLNLWVDVSTLTHSKNQKKTPPPSVNIHVQKKTEGKLEIDCRGMRLDEFERMAFYHLEELACGDIPYLSIVHGHGDGVLKTWLRKYLNQRKEDFMWSSPDGNDGSTIVKLIS